MLRSYVDFRPYECWAYGSEIDGGFAQFSVVPAREVYAVRCDWPDTKLASIPCAYSTAAMTTPAEADHLLASSHVAACFCPPRGQGPRHQMGQGQNVLAELLYLTVELMRGGPNFDWRTYAFREARQWGCDPDLALDSLAFAGDFRLPGQKRQPLFCIACVRAMPANSGWSGRPLLSAARRRRWSWRPDRGWLWRRRLWRSGRNLPR